MKHITSYYKDIKTLLDGLKTVRPISNDFHIHQFKDTPDTWVKETSIFRSDTYSIILLTKGKAKYKIGLTDYEIGDGSLYFQAPQHLRYYNRLSEWDGYVLVFMESFFEDDVYLKNLITNFDGFKITSKVVVPLENEALLETERILQLLYDVSYSESTLKFQKAKSLLELLILQSQEHYQKRYNSQKESKQHHIVKEFERITEQHLYDITQNKVERLLTISEIAKQININATYLGEVLKKTTGKTPKEILSDRIALEAKSLLYNTDMAINEIAYFLKFQDASNFTKFFKSKTGVSPVNYRLK
ncbi:response regulator transcription factor [uncultured Aquimarina sp.]|uniref:helix-turn-helix domain-containing protein n=1 Tax=uncultured Aquimarina sp. TaxID=575652 RepID=UPI0026208A14|nr:response regulator transcription factor [uncultured Aquimarina sp.]